MKIFRFLGLVLICSFVLLFFSHWTLAAWSSQTSSTSNTLESIDFFDIDPNYGVAGGDSSTTRYTSNGGSTWNTSSSSPSPANIIDMSIGSTLGGNPYVYAVASNANIYISADNGDTYSSTVVAADIILSGVKAVDVDYAYVVGRNSISEAVIYKTEDGGSIWSLVWTDTGNTGNLNDIDCFKSGSTYSCYAVGWSGSEALIVKRTLAAKTSETWNTTAKTGSQLYDVSQLDDTNAYAVGIATGPESLMYKTTDGSTWSSVSITTGGALNGVDFIDNNLGWVVGNNVGGYGVINYTTDGGTSWTAQTTTVPDLRLNSIKASSAGLAWLAGNTGTILNWTDTAGPTISTAFPAATYYNAVSWDAQAISGTSTEDKSVQSGVETTILTIKRNSDLKYWDGNSWETSSTNLTVSGTAEAWSYSGLTSAGFESDGSYTLTVASTDFADNTDSEATVFTYDNTAPITIADPAGGNYTTSQNVTLTASDATSGVTATYYTTDGSAPTIASLVYSSPLTILETTTLKFFSIDNAGNSESISTEIYAFSPVPEPEPEPEPDEIEFTKKITLDSSYLNKTLINNKNKIDLKFSKLPNNPSKYWLKLEKIKKIPAGFKNKSIKYYSKLTTNLYKYKHKIRVNLFFKYTSKKLKKNNLKAKNLYLIKFNKKTKVWEKVKKARLNKSRKWLKLVLTEFKKKTTKYAIVSK